MGHEHHAHDRGHAHSHHGHGHGHGHAHGHAPADFGRAFAIGVTLNAGFVVLEAVTGWFAGSLALMADAGHNLSDVAGLLMAWGAAKLAQSKPSARRTYGMGRSTILASLANAMLLLAAVGAILWEAVRRFMAPEPIAAGTVIAVAGAGILVNAFTAMLFFRGRAHDLNVRGAYLHMAADAGVSLGVVIATLAIMTTGWLWLDPAMSVAIALVIAWGTWDLLVEAVGLAMDAVPRSVDRQAVEDFLKGQPGVVAIHDLHIWALSTTATALTAHIVRPGEAPHDTFLAGLATALRERFAIGHATIQIEAGYDCPDCSLASEAA